ncbi:MAG: hypothetical protein AAFR54_16925, partial [Planctomycetota bacterium]
AHDQYLGAPSTETPAKDRASLFTGTVDWRVAHERDFTAGAVEYTVEVFGIDDGVERSLWTSDVLLEPEWICTAEFQRELPATFVVQVAGWCMLSDEERIVLHRHYTRH